MKRIFYFASILLLASSIVSCQKELQNEENPINNKGGVTVNVVAGGEVESKTSAVVDGTTTKFKWTEGDAITLYEYVDGVQNESKDSDPATISPDGYSATFKVTLQKSNPEGSNYVYTACYPAGAFTTTEKHNRYQIPNTQTLTADGNFDPSADIMFGKTEPRTSRVADDTDMGFSFKRLGTVVKLTIKGILKDEVINYITITAPEKVAGYSDIDFMTGVVGTVAYDAVNSLRLNSGEFKASGSADGDVVWFRCIEGTWKAGDKFTIVIDTDKAGYTKEITIPTSGLEFSTGGLTKLTIGSLGNFRTPKTTTTYNKITAAPDDWSGEYLLVYENEGKAYIWTGVDATNCYVEATITDNAITSLPTGAATLTIAAIDGGYSIKINGGTNDGKYIGKDDYNNGMSISETALVNTLKIAEGAAKISGAGASGDTHVTIRYNSNSDQKRFRYYKSGQQAVQLYKLDDNKTLTGIELNTENVTKEFTVNGEFNHDGLIVTANYDNGSSADVSESANLTVTAPDMTTAGENKDVTVTYKEGDAEFSETYKINVIEGTISVESISLDKEELSIEIEKTETLVATISPNTASNKGIVWSSNDEGIATVDENGVVTGVAVGTATITATSEENENISASCTVTVTPKVSVANISLSNSFYGVTKGNNGEEQTKTTDGVTIVSGCTSSASNKTYYDTNHIRYYADSYLKVSVDGTISKIVLSEPSSSKKWDGIISVSPDTYSTDTKTWTGSAAEVDFSFAAQNRIASIEVTFIPDGKTRYDVTCATVDGGTLSATPSRATAGESITLTATPADEEWSFNNDWSVVDASSNPVEVLNGKFTMPASNVTVNGSFTKKTYTIKRGTAEHGTFTINGTADDNQTAHKGDQITVVAEAESGYEHTGWTVTKDTEGTVTVYNGKFTMPNDNVTVTPVFTEAALIPEYASLADLVAAGKPSATETTVKVTLTNEVITAKASSYICVMSGNQEVKLYKSSVPAVWAVGGTVSGTLQCPWLLYGGTDWELKPDSWGDLTYTPTCSKPTISFSEGKATISAAEGTTIKYAVNQDADTQPELTLTYEAPFTVNDGDVVWAKATATDQNDSEVESKKYTAGGGQGGGTTTPKYVKVTTTDNLTDGTYLIVYEKSSTEARIFNGLDAANDYVEATITNSEIASSNSVDAVTVTINTMTGGYSIKIDDGDKKDNYIYGKSGSNSIQYGKTAIANEITFSSGLATILSNSTSLRYNAASGNDRFRYYKTTTTGNTYIYPALYKKVN